MEPRFRGLDRFTLGGIAAAAVAVLGLLAAVYWISEARTRAAEWVVHTHEARLAVAATRAAVFDLQASREPASRAALDAALARLRGLTADNPSQQARIGELDRALAGIAADAAPGRMEGARAVLDALDAEEQRLLGLREQELAEDIGLFWVVAGSMVAALFVALGVFHVLVRRREAQQLALLQSEQRFHLFTQTVTDYAMLMLDPVGRVTSWNAGAERIKGYSASEILGRHFSVFYSPEDAAEGKPARELDIAAEFGRYEEEGWRVRKDGSRFWAHVVIVALRDPDRRVTGFGKVTRDLTERKAADDALQAENARRRATEARLAQANERLEERVEERTAQLRESHADLLEATQRLQELSGRLITAQEEERKRIARELHDETGQALTGIRLRLKDALVAGVHNPGRLEECVGIVDQAVAHIRGLAVNLRPPMLDDLGLADALEWALGQQAKVAGWRASIDTGAYGERVAADIETACFRIGQEALTNAARHAEATEVRVELHVAGNAIELVIADDGRGFDQGAFASPEERRKHFGLVSMRERAALAGGTLEVQSERGKGTRIRARFPIDVLQ
jgi:PAS domain S-box-containing protein